MAHSPTALRNVGPGGGDHSPAKPLQTSHVDVVAALLAPAVHQLFAVTLSLSAAAADSNDEIAGRILDAVGRVDQAIHLLRQRLLTVAA